MEIDNKYKKNVLVSAYMHFNLGDDLFLKILFERYPNVCFHLLSPPSYYDAFIQNYPNARIIRTNILGLRDRVLDAFFIRVFPRFFSKRFKKRCTTLLKEYNVDNCNAYLRIGGSLFIQNKTYKVYREIEFYEVLIKNFPDVSLYFLGGNFGPFIDSKYFNGYKSVFSKSKDVCFRDSNSKDLFADLNTVRCAPDIVFSLKYKLYPKIPKSIGISLVSPVGRGIEKENEYLKNISLLIYDLINRDKSVYLFSFCSKEGDEEFIKNVMINLDPDIRKKINVIFYDGEIDNFLALYSRMEINFCGRFHAIILGILFQQNIIPIIYSDKMTNYLDDISFEGDRLYISNFKIDNVESLLDNKLNNTTYLNVDSLKEQSISHFVNLDKQIVSL